MKAIQNLLPGASFGRWTVIGKPFRDRRKTYVLAECRCGKRLPVEAEKLTDGNSKSCGCQRREVSALLSQFDEQGRPKYSWIGEYGAWRTLRFKTRCPNARGFLATGAQGIKVCPEWDEFATFAQDMSKRPLKHSLIRLDRGKDFCADNCAWSASKHRLEFIEPQPVSSTMNHAVAI